MLNRLKLIIKDNLDEFLRNCFSSFLLVIVWGKLKENRLFKILSCNFFFFTLLISFHQISSFSIVSDANGHESTQIYIYNINRFVNFLSRDKGPAESGRRGFAPFICFTRQGLVVPYWLNYSLQQFKISSLIFGLPKDNKKF